MLEYSRIIILLIIILGIYILYNYNYEFFTNFSDFNKIFNIKLKDIKWNKKNNLNQSNYNNDFYNMINKSIFINDNINKFNNLNKVNEDYTLIGYAYNIYSNVIFKIYEKIDYNTESRLDSIIMSSIPKLTYFSNYYNYILVNKYNLQIYELPLREKINIGDIQYFKNIGYYKIIKL